MKINDIPLIDSARVIQVIDMIIFCVEECNIFYTDITAKYINIEFKTFKNLEKIYFQEVVNLEIVNLLNQSNYTSFTRDDIIFACGTRHMEDVKVILELKKKEEIEKKTSKTKNDESI